MTYETNGTLLVIAANLATVGCDKTMLKTRCYAC